ncbi:hypothetical protein BDV19DRAFT_252680 [Aspergillus venezuelensis]
MSTPLESMIARTLHNYWSATTHNIAEQPVLTILENLDDSAGPYHAMHRVLRHYETGPQRDMPGAYSRWYRRGARLIYRLIEKRRSEYPETVVLPVGRAIMSRSLEDLKQCLWPEHIFAADEGAPSADTILFMCLGWPDGLKLFFQSPICEDAQLVSECFQEACIMNGIHCARILVGHLDVVKNEDLHAAALTEQPEIVAAVVDELSQRRFELNYIWLIRFCQMTPCADLVLRHTLPIALQFRYMRRYWNPRSCRQDSDMCSRDYPRLAAPVYSGVAYDLSIANRLYAAGFTGLNQRDQNGLSALMHIGTLRPPESRWGVG